MKVGIITRHNALNAGAVLQAFALQTQLMRMGFDVEFIDYRISTSRTVKSFFSFSYRKTIEKWKDFIFSLWYERNFLYANGLLKIGDKKYVSLFDLRSCPPKFDIYIAGSDQIWNVGTNFKAFEPYFLNFGDKDIKRISFAASFGQCNFSKSIEDLLRNQFYRFNAISVREENGADFLRNLLNNKQEVKQISDPTFLLSSNDYVKIMSEINFRKISNFIVSYILSEYHERQYQIVDYIKYKLGIELINLRNPASCIRLKGAKNLVVNPRQWLSYFYHSNFIICTSFHAVVFSLIFHKPFIVISTFNNERIISLLTKTHLLDHYHTDFNAELINELLIKEVPWSQVDQVIEEEKNKGILYLSNNLN